MDNMTDIDDVVTTQRGAPSIVFQGFTFRKDKTDEKGELSFWRCRHKGCPGRLVADAGMKKARLTKPHEGHFPKANVAQAAKIVTKVRERVVNEKGPVNRIYREETRAVADDTETLQLLPTFATMKSGLYKSRKEKFGPVPARLAEFVVPEKLQRLDNGESFLLFQSDDNKIVVFGTEKDFATVCTTDELFVDGTFEAVPRFFTQLFTIHTFNGEKQFPRLYCFLENKTAEIYTNLIDALKNLAQNKGLEFSPKKITSDFESGWISAVHESLQTTSINGCFFHFTQAVVRKINSMGLMKKFLENEPFRNIVREVIGLAFLPTDKVMTTLGKITETSPDEETSSFLEYFMGQWVIRVQPQLWNVRGRVHRTNNDLESWHNRLNLDVGKAKNVFFIIQCLINDHLDAVVLERQMESGEAISLGKKKDEAKNNAIKRLERDLEAGAKSEKEFCRAIGSLMVK